MGWMIVKRICAVTKKSCCKERERKRETDRQRQKEREKEGGDIIRKFKQGVGVNVVAKQRKRVLILGGNHSNEKVKDTLKFSGFQLIS